MNAPDGTESDPAARKLLPPDLADLHPFLDRLTAAGCPAFFAAGRWAATRAANGANNAVYRAAGAGTPSRVPGPRPRTARVSCAGPGAGYAGEAAPRAARAWVSTLVTCSRCESACMRPPRKRPTALIGVAPSLTV